MENNASSAQVQQFLENVSYPSTKEDLLATAREQGADQEVLDAIEQFPEGNYDSPVDVSKALGELQ